MNIGICNGINFYNKKYIYVYVVKIFILLLFSHVKKFEK